MLRHIKNEMSSRLSELRMNFVQCKHYNTVIPNESFIKSNKGHIFVYLYGIYEWTLYETVKNSIYIINQQLLKPRDFKPELLSLVLNNKCKSLYNVGNSNKWNKYRELFIDTFSNNHNAIEESLMPTDGKNPRYLQLREIENTFKLHRTLLLNERDRVDIQELVQNRCDIAHGNNRPSDIGSRYTNSEIELKINFVELTCTNIVEVFEEYLVDKKYLN